MLRRLALSNTWANAHPKEYAEVFQRLTGLPADVVKLVVGRDRPQLRAVDQQIITQLQQVADTFFEAKLFPRRVDASRLVDATLFRPA